MDSTQTPLAPELETTSLEFAGRWHRLVSTTNWEKGRLIHEWRSALIEADAPATSYSDEAWSRRVGGVSGQHVGRLRRVWERFADTRDTYTGLFWSHFAASLEWEDAELWLEGAVQNQWSVARMREGRWEALGAPADKKPRPEEVISSEWDEEAGQGTDVLALPRLTADLAEVMDPSGSREPDRGPDDSYDESAGEQDETAPWEDESSGPGGPAESARPFADLPELPDDLAEAVDQFKLVIVRYREEAWQSVSQETVLATIEALRRFALLSG